MVFARFGLRLSATATCLVAPGYWAVKWMRVLQRLSGLPRRLFDTGKSTGSSSSSILIRRLTPKQRRDGLLTGSKPSSSGPEHCVFPVCPVNSIGLGLTRSVPRHTACESSLSSLPDCHYRPSTGQRAHIGPTEYFAGDTRPFEDVATGAGRSTFAMILDNCVAGRDRGQGIANVFGTPVH